MVGYGSGNFVVEVSQGGVLWVESASAVTLPDDRNSRGGEVGNEIPPPTPGDVVSSG